MMSPVTTDLVLMDHRERLVTAERIRHVRIARAARFDPKKLSKESSWDRSLSAASSAWTGTPKDAAET